MKPSTDTELYMTTLPMWLSFALGASPDVFSWRSGWSAGSSVGVWWSRNAAALASVDVGDDGAQGGYVFAEGCSAGAGGGYPGGASAVVGAFSAVCVVGVDEC